MNIVVIPGTNRRESLTFRLGELVAGHYGELADHVDLLDLSGMGAEFLDPASYSNRPPAMAAMIDRFMAGDGLVFIVPEYNGSYPGTLKLFIDMLPYPTAFEGRPCAFIGLAGGQFRGLRAVEHLQHVAGHLHAYLYPRRVFIGESRQLLGDDGQLADADLAARLERQAQGFVNFVAALREGG